MKHDKIAEASDASIERLLKILSKPSKPHYASSVPIRKAVKAARELAIDVAGIELGKDGTIRIFDARLVEWLATRDLNRAAPPESTKG